MAGREEQIAALIERTIDAYSFNRYGRKNWELAIRRLLRIGFSEREIEAILLSKWMRWAADGVSDQYGDVKSGAIIEYINDQTRRYGRMKVSADLAELVEQTFAN